MTIVFHLVVTLSILFSFSSSISAADEVCYLDTPSEYQRRLGGQPRLGPYDSVDACESVRKQNFGINGSCSCQPKTTGSPRPGTSIPIQKPSRAPTIALPPERQAELAQGDAEFDHAGRLTDQVAASFLNHSLKSTVEERFNWLAETIAPLRQAAINKMLEAKDISHKFEVEFQLLQNEVKNLNAQRPGPKAGAAAIEAFNNLVDRYNNKVQDYNDRLNRESGRWLSEAMQATGKLVKMNGPLAEFNKVAGGLLDGTAPSAGGIRWRQSAKGDAPVPQKTKLTQKELDIKVQAALALAFLAVKKANYDEALRYLQDARAAKPKDQKIRAAYLYVLSLKNRPPRIKPSSKATYLLDALDYGKGDWEKSLDYLNNIEFDRAGNVDAQAAEEALRNLKVVYAEFLARQAVDRISRKDFEGAMTSLKRANELDPDTDGHRHLLTCIQDTLEEMDRDRRTKKR